jgi:hypothetical protein
MNRFVVVAAMLGVAVVWPGSAAAQPLGTFRWQQLPYCNVITVRVVQADAVFQLDGVDDQCGTGTQASVVGLAFQNPNGSIGLGLTIVTAPGGTPLHIDATVSLPGASGTWRDSAGNTGAFALTPGAAVPGSPRPVPKATFPGGISSGGSPINNVGSPVAGTDAANKDYVDGVVATKATTADVRAALIGEKVWKGQIGSGGAKASTGNFVSSRVSLGNYAIRVDVTGLGLPPAFPLIVATPAGISGARAVVFVQGYSFMGAFLTEIRAQVLTFDAAGAAADSGIFVMMTLPDADTGSPVTPLVAADSANAVKCSQSGEVTSCDRRMPQ